MANLIEETSVPLDSTVVEALLGAPPPATDDGGWTRLDFAVQHQLQTQWCWAAVSVSIADFYEAPTTWTQCQLVCSARGVAGCCDEGGSIDCNQPWYVDQALTHLDAFVATEEVSAADVGGWLPPSVEQDIADGRPVGLAVFWDGGGGHAIVLEGYRGDRTMVAIEDPWEGSSDMPAALLHRYKGTGTWGLAFRTQPPATPTQPPS